MSLLLVAIVTLIYTVAALVEFYHMHHWPMGVVLLGYAIANMGLIAMKM